MMVEKTAVGRGEKEGEEARKHALLIQTAGMTERASAPLSICLSDPQGRDEAVAQEGAQNSVKMGVHFGTHRSRVSVHASHEALTRHSPVAHGRTYVRATRAYARRLVVSSLVRLHTHNCSLPDANTAFLMDMLLAAPRPGRSGIRKFEQ
jgi:hypothetical protein